MYRTKQRKILYFVCSFKSLENLIKIEFATFYFNDNHFFLLNSNIGFKAMQVENNYICKNH